MIITQTPFRMSFFGGGTDMESFFRENGGAVLSTTFDKYCYTWKLKRQTGSAVSTNSIDELYAKGIAAGALGGKLLGAGGGGFLVFYVQPERQDAVRWAMRDLLYIPFQFENSGTRVIHYTPEDYVPKD